MKEPASFGPVTPGDFERIREVFEAALETAPDERSAFVEKACGGNVLLIGEVQRMLAGHGEHNSLLDGTPLAGPRLRRGAAFAGNFHIGELIGSGGMGEVYRGRDSRLNRDVAIKVLPDSLAGDSGRLIRFQREAHLLASLNHPNIAAIYGIEESDGVRALILELVEGPTLSDRIANGPIPLDEAVPIAKQIAEALEGAHEQGVIHRDLKPANIKLRPDGAVKVLDFGLAKALRPVEGARGKAPDSRTVTSPVMTEVGVILGTPAYMAPEQAKGKAVDRRADIWAFGAVLYEMLSGRRAFEGEGASETLASVLGQEIDWTAIPPSTPAALTALMSRCLDRDPSRRLRDIGEARIVLEQLSTTGDTFPEAMRVAPPRVAGRVWLWIAALGTAAVAFAAGAAWSIWRAPSTASAVARFTHTLPAGQSIALPASRHMVTVSPDGQQMVYVVDGGLQLRSMSSLEARTIRGSETQGAVTTPVFSPKGDVIAFWTPVDRTIKRIPVTGGEAVSIAAADDPYGMSWHGDTLLFGQGSKGIMRVRADGGTPELLVRVHDDEEAHGPQMLPDGDHVLFTLAAGTGPDRWDAAKIVVQSLSSEQRSVIISGGSDARYVPTGHLVYGRSDTGFGAGAIFAVTFDVAQRKVTGTSAPVIEAVRTSSNRSSGAFQFDLSASGTLVYVPGSRVGPEWGKQQLVLADRTGRVEPLPLTPNEYRAIRVSPDGSRIALEVGAADHADIYIYDVGRSSSLRRLTFGGRNRDPVWSADGRRIAFQSDREGDRAIFSEQADGGGAAVRLTRPANGESHAPEGWSPDGGTLLFSITTSSHISLATLSIGDARVTASSNVRSAIPVNARFSPDGRWIAYTQGDRGTASTIYVEPFPATGAKYQLLVQGPPGMAHKPVWSPDGRELLYVPRLGGFEAVNVTTRPTFAFGSAFRVPRKFNPGAPSVRALYDITPTGRFVGVIPVGDSDAIYSASQIRVVLNWLEELRRLVPTK